MFHKLIGILFFTLVLSGQGHAQGDFEKWDANYAEVNLAVLLGYEQQYADSIEAISGKDEYYFRGDKYRFEATYLGLKRRLDPKVMKSMKNVLGLLGGDAEQLDELLGNEYFFQVGEIRFWAPMQRQLEEPFAEEVRKGEAVTLYCLFLNEHSSSGLYNTFLVSEFRKE